MILYFLLPVMPHQFDFQLDTVILFLFDSHFPQYPALWAGLRKVFFRTRKKEWGSHNPSNLKADVTWLPTSKGPANCTEGEIIYVWLAFSLVNVNELSTWLLSEPWPWPPWPIHHQITENNTHFCFNYALLGLISDLQIVKLTLVKARGLDQISTRPPAPR